MSAKIEFNPDFGIAGFKRVILDREKQKILQCVAGETITRERPLMKINKSIIQEQLAVDDEDEFNAFLPYKREIIDFPKDRILMGYVISDLHDYDEFYLCLTDEAEKLAERKQEEVRKYRESLAKTAFYKAIKKWESLNSEEYVDYNVLIKNRELLKVELETKYPPFSQPNFGFSLVGNRKHYYTDLIVTEKYAVPIVFKKRADVEIQAKPTYSSHEAQTIFNFPKNSWTQYRYDCDYEDKEISETLVENLELLAPQITEKITVNGNLNLYTSDYINLIKHKIKIPQVLQLKEELISLKDTKRCLHKSITTFTWHPKWTGILAVAYGIHSPLLTTSKTNEEKHSVTMNSLNYSEHPILIWSLSQPFEAIMQLETCFEVHCLEFSPYNENILIGGCSNGQILIWTVRLEPTKIKTVKQVEYHRIMFRTIGWDPNVKDITNVYPVAKLEGHKSTISSIFWLDSNRFVSASVDGALLIWSLDKVDLTKGKAADNKFTAENQINLMVQNKICPITKALAATKGNFLAGTHQGDFILASWKCDEYDSATILFTKRYHDGPVSNIEKHPIYEDVYLSVGGKTFAIWKISFEIKPIYLRTSRCKYTYGQWSKEPGGVWLNRTDGYREIWDLSGKNSSFLSEINFSGKALVKSATQNDNLAIADEDGWLYIMKIPDNQQNASFKAVIENNEKSKSILCDWQEKWTRKHAAHTLKQIEDDKLEQARLSKLKEKRRVKEKELARQQAEINAKKAAALAKPPPGFKAEWSHAKWLDKEHAAVSTMMIERRNFRPTELRLEEIPIKRRETEARAVRAKKRTILKQSDQIFTDIVKGGFLELIEVKVKEKSDVEGLNKIKKKYVENYREVKNQANLFVIKNPYEYSFDWKEVIKKGKLKLEQPLRHKLRRQREKNN